MELAPGASSPALVYGGEDMGTLQGVKLPLTLQLEYERYVNFSFMEALFCWMPHVKCGSIQK